MIRAASNARRVAFPLAVVAWFGVALQLVLSLQLSVANGRTWAAGLISYLGFFTVLTNLLVCASITARVLAGGSRLGRFASGPFVSGGVATSIIFVAVSYHLLLRKIWHPQGAALLADLLLHYVTPALFVAYWFFCIRRNSLRWTDPFLWSIYPSVYFVYALVRGELIGSYPYGFIDVAAIGYGYTLRNAVALLFGFIILGGMVVGIDRLQPSVNPQVRDS